MCGIFGYVGHIKKDKGDFWTLLGCLASASESRGTDSTGFAARFKDGSVQVDKMPVPASTFRWMSPKYISLRNRLPKAFIGHTRYGTGSSPLINNNNHPFLGSSYHMVHNGTIPSWRDIMAKNELELVSETDSEVILRGFEKQLAEGKTERASIEWTLNNIWGNMAVALLSHTENTIWLFRNDNPLHVITFPTDMWDSNVVMFCSTEDIFKWAWKRAFNNDVPDSVKIWQIESNQAYKMSTVPHHIEGEPHYIVKHPIVVDKKFAKSKIYCYGEYGYSTSWYNGGTSSTTIKLEKFFTTWNPWKPEEPFVLAPVDATKLSELLNAGKDFSIDGMSAKEFDALNTLVGELTNENRERTNSPNHEAAML